MVVAFILLESLLRGTYISTINTIAVILAVVGTIILLINFWQPLLIAGLIAVACFLLVQKLRELRE